VQVPVFRDRLPSLLAWLLAAACSAGGGAGVAAHATADDSAFQQTGAREHVRAAVALADHELDPAPFDAVLRAHVRDGRVDYRALKRDAGARAKLGAFVESAVRMSPQAPLASWLNVYNALVVQQVLERYPIDSVMAVSGFFDKLRHPVAGEPRTLDGIEHGVIRKRFPDARVHFALNCGAVSCPPLSPRAFRESTLDARLDALARAAVNDPAHVERQGDALHVSALFFWFREDFVRDAGSVQKWIDRYADPKGLGAVAADAELVQRDYDWALAAVK
jgi:hypothetical protein